MGVVRWAELTSQEIGSAGRAGALAVVPLGCTEQHGLHLPVDTDTYQVDRLAIEGAILAAKSSVEILVLPTLPFGPASEHYGYPGTISLDSAVYLQIIKDIVRSVIDSGFRRIAVIHGCGGHWVVPSALWDVKAETVRANKDVVIRHISVSDDWERLQQEIFPGSGDTSGGHASVVETALCLAGREHLVQLDRHRIPTVDRLDQRYRRHGEVFLFSDISDTGALGDASGATVEGGTRFWEEMTGRLALLFVEMAHEDGVSVDIGPLTPAVPSSVG